MTNYSRHLQSTQRQPLFGRESEQVQNSAGGFVFQADPWHQLRRFLVIGSAGGTYYADEKKLTAENARVVVELLATDGPRVVQEITRVSVEGLAHKNDPAIFALALACAYGNPETKRVAYNAIVDVCRTGTHLFHFCEAVNSLRGWSRGLRRGVAAWYEKKKVEALEYQLIKYRQRDGWTHRDVLSLAHPKGATPEHETLYAWATGKPLPVANEPQELFSHAKVRAFERLKELDTARGPGVVLHGESAKIAQLIESFDLPWEALPTRWLNDPVVLEALFPHMPLGALVRNLGRYTRAGLAAPFADLTAAICDRLGNAEEVARSRLHPIALLLALKAYGNGAPLTKSRGREDDTWEPSQAVLSALEDAFELSFKNIKPAGVPTIVALDVSGSMGAATGGTLLTCREASVALAMATVRSEPATEVMAFSDRFVRVPITRRTSLRDAMKLVSNLPFERTDCSLPFLWALENKIKNVGNFAVYTDNETYAGEEHPTVALQRYRQWAGVAARSAVVGMTATGFTIADPKDPGMLDVAGFSADTPAVLAAFARGEA